MRKLILDWSHLQSLELSPREGHYTVFSMNNMKHYQTNKNKLNLENNGKYNLIELKEHQNR